VTKPAGHGGANRQLALSAIAACSCWTVWAQPAQRREQPALIAPQQFAAVSAQAQKLAAEGRTQEAVAHCEAFMREHANAAKDNPSGFLTLAGTVYRILGTVEDKAARGAQYRRLFTEFRDVPAYAAMGAKGYLDCLIETKGEPAEMEAFGREAVKAFGDALPRTYEAAMLLVNLGRALQKQGKIDEAEDLAAAAALRWPTILENVNVAGLLSDCAWSRKDYDGMVGAAKLCYMLCAFDEKSIGKARNLVIQALTAKGGPGLATQFVKAQDSAEVENPLKDVPLPKLTRTGAADALLQPVAQVAQPANQPVGQVAEPVEQPPTTPQADVAQAAQPADLLAAARGYRPARILAQLALGDFAGALADATAEMRDAKTTDQMVRALGDVARCLKAKDLNLIRANQFLEFQRTGKGENPLPTF